MWGEACPSANAIFSRLTLEDALLLTQGLSNEIVAQLALWTDVVGHLSNATRANATPPARVLAEGGEMLAARLRHLAVLCDGAKSVIIVIRAAALRL